MKDISSLSVDIFKLSDKIIEKAVEAQRETAEQIAKDAKSLSPVRSGRYQSSIRVFNTEENNGVFKTFIGTDLAVGGTNKKWSNWALGIFLEHGTGPNGMATYAGPNSPVFRDTPWWYFDTYLDQWVFTYGLYSRPHFYPALNQNISTYKRNIKKAIREAH